VLLREVLGVVHERELVVLPAPAQPTMEALQAEIVVLKDALAEREQELARLRQQLGVCCPWWEQQWHRPH
jgi:hypothetical protein